MARFISFEQIRFDGEYLINVLLQQNASHDTYIPLELSLRS